MNSRMMSVALCLSVLAVAGCQHHQQGMAESSLMKIGAPERAKDFSALDRFKALAGRWEGDGGSSLEYRTIAGGSAVEERLFPGSPHEMVTMYFTHYGDLYASHYCASKNVPTMHGHWHDKDSTWHFEHVSTTNADPKTTQVMGDMSYTFIDADTIKASWNSFKDGKTVGDGHGGIYKRVSKAK